MLIDIGGAAVFETGHGRTRRPRISLNPDPAHTRRILLPGLTRRPYCSLITYLHTLAASSSLVWHGALI